MILIRWYFEQGNFFYDFLFRLDVILNKLIFLRFWLDHEQANFFMILIGCHFEQANFFMILNRWHFEQANFRWCRKILEQGHFMWNGSIFWTKSFMWHCEI
jgi:hypothetical protein